MSQKYILVSDNSSHNYLIKLEEYSEFNSWLEWNDMMNDYHTDPYLSQAWDGKKDFDECRIDGFEGRYSFENPEEI